MLMQASNQWMRRPADERFTSLDDMLAAMRVMRDRSAAKVLPNTKLIASPVQDAPDALVITADGQTVMPTHWAFGQMASLVGAPAGYLRTLPAPLAADNLNYGLKVRNIEEIGLLATADPQGIVPDLRAATGPNYGRVWNAAIIEATMARFGNGVDGDFTVPGHFGKALDEVTKANTTLYAGDRDMFIFLADEQNRIEIPNRRNGQPGMLARGFFITNSEVGSSALKVTTFLFDYVCFNRIVWGATQVQEITLRHTAGAPMRWAEEIEPAMLTYAHSSTKGITEAIAAAQEARLGEKLDEFLRERFTANQSKAIKLAHEAAEGRPIETLWDVAVGATQYAQGIEYQDRRVEIERTAGKIIDLAAA